MIAVVGVMAVLLLAAGGASAGTYLIEHSHSQGVDYANVSFNGGVSTESAYLGRFLMEPITPAVPPNSTLPPEYPIYKLRDSCDGIHTEMGFYSYCLEPLVTIKYGHKTEAQYQFSIDPLVGTADIDAGDALLIRELLGRYSPLLQNDPTGPYTGGSFRTAAGALQLAIWKINLDRTTETLGKWDFASGLMRVASGAPLLETGASAKADAVALLMLNSLTGIGPMASGLEGLRSTATQDLIIQPEPATMALMALGVVGLLARRRRGK
jgi:hypothetical protein